MKIWFGLVAVFGMWVMNPMLANSIDFNDPTWPCIQRKIPRVLIGQMWSGTLPPESAPERKKIISALGSPYEQTFENTLRQISLRRTSLEEIEAQVEDFARGLNNNQNLVLAVLFASVFDRLETTRRRLVGKIANYSKHQLALAKKIDQLRNRLDAEKQTAGNEPSFEAEDAMEALSDEILWNERIYIERQGTLTFVCESPVLLEKREFAIARIIAGHLK